MRLALAFFLAVATAALASAQGTGTLAGTIVDQNGTPLPGASVLIVGTSLGAATDADGLYRIIGIPVGRYEVTAQFIGYQTFSIQNVEIRSGYTTTLDFTLAEEDQQLSEVVVEYERPIIQRDAIGAPRTVTNDDYEARSSPGRSRRAEARSPAPSSSAAVREQEQLVGTIPAQYGDIRGGREGSVSHYVDGVRVASPPGDAGRYAPPVDRENYAAVEEVGFRRPDEHPLSTFAIDVDRASYANVRRMLLDGYLPPPDAVRIEEFVNYFTYDYADPEGRHPFSVTADVTTCPWAPAHRLVRVGLQARRLDLEDLPPSNLVFLVDVSGSMNSPDKLPLVQQSLRLLVRQLRPQDRVALVVYAGAAGLVLPPTSGTERATILAAIDRLQAGGSTAGGAGLRLAYAVARQHYDRQGNNRVILATDGDFNVGVSSDAEMQRLVEEERESGVFLSVLGFGTGNLQDAKMEAMADHGNGQYAYIDSIQEARRVFVQELGGTLAVLAKDVKIQVEFNPARVAGYRLIGYENRALRDEEFNDDTRNAGELGAGHSVTALYEIVPVGVRTATEIPDSDPLRYQTSAPATGPFADELLVVKLRYKPSTGPGQFADESVRLEEVVRDRVEALEDESDDLRFAVAVAEFGMLLRGSAYRGDASWAHARELARAARGTDADGYRAELVRLIETAETIAGAQADASRVMDGRE